MVADMVRQRARRRGVGIAVQTACDLRRISRCSSTDVLYALSSLAKALLYRQTAFIDHLLLALSLPAGG